MKIVLTQKEVMEAISLGVYVNRFADADPKDRLDVTLSGSVDEETGDLNVSAVIELVTVEAPDEEA